MTREFFKKLESGEYVYQWNGYYPYYAGCFYGDGVCLGGEEKFNHCYNWFSGIGDVEWWIKEELDKLSEKEQEELLFILKRNKEFDNLKKEIAPKIAEILNVEPYQVHRLKNKQLYDFINLIHKNSNTYC